MDASSESDTCWSIVGRAAAGDGAARSVFSRTYLPLVRTFLVTRWRETFLASDLDDAVQETFLECFRPEGPLTRASPARGDFRGFLFGIVRNVALRFEERARQRGERQPESAAVLAEIASREASASQAFDREWARTQMREAGALMQSRAHAGGAGARLRVELLRLRFAEELPIRTIATQWEMDPDAIHRAYAKAREEFHFCLREILRRQTARTEPELDDECRRLCSLLA